MKKILIAPRFFELGNTYRIFATNTIGDFLLKLGIMPYMPFYSTDIKSVQSAYDFINKNCQTCDGIILQGGNDISSIMYGEESKNVHGAQIFRDYFEYALINFAIKNQIPIFGICRGMQMLNVSLGGSLHQHLDEGNWNTHMNTKNGKFTEKDIEQIEHTFHDVVITNEGIFKNLYESERLKVNSYHHQGVKKVGDNLKVEAKGLDNLVEAISWEKQGILGVQWHPELDWDNLEFSTSFIWWIENFILMQKVKV